MMVAGERGKTPRVVQADGIEIKEVKPTEEVKVDKRQSLWDELDAKGIEYKKNMSKSKLEELLQE